MLLVNKLGTNHARFVATSRQQHFHQSFSKSILFPQTFDNKLVPEKRFPCQDLPTFTANLKLSKPQLTSYTRELKRDIVMVGGRVPAEQCMIAPIKQNTGVIGFVVLLSLTKR